MGIRNDLAALQMQSQVRSTQPYAADCAQSQLDVIAAQLRDVQQEFAVLTERIRVLEHGRWTPRAGHVGGGR